MKTKYSLQKRIIALGMMVIFLTMSLAVIKPVKVHAYQTILSKYTVIVEKNYQTVQDSATHAKLSHSSIILSTGKSLKTILTEVSITP